MRPTPLLPFALLAGCSLFGPPLPPATPRPDIVEYEAQPVRAREAFIACARRYGEAHGRADEVSAESIADAAIYACSTELDAYRVIAADRAQGKARVLGFIDRSDSHTEEAVEEATKEARSAALDAIVRARSAG